MENKEIEFLVKKKGKSRRNASIEMGMNLSTLNHILEKDIRTATGKNLLILSKYLNISVDELLNENNIKDSKIEINEINLLLLNFNSKQLKIIKNIIENIEEINKIKEN